MIEFQKLNSRLRPETGSRSLKMIEGEGDRTLCNISNMSVKVLCVYI